MEMEKKSLNELTDEELDVRIIYSGFDDIISALERMTSGNFMHNKLNCIYMVRNVRGAVERLIKMCDSEILKSWDVLD